MAKKKNTNRISFKEIKDFLPEAQSLVEKITLGSGEAAKEIEVKKSLSFKEYGSFIKELADMVFVSNESGKLSYAPYTKDFSFRYLEIFYFTNIELPDGMKDVEALIGNDELFEKIDGVIGADYLAKVKACVEEAIQSKVSEINNTSKIDKIVTLFEDMLGTMSDKIGKMDAQEMLDYFKDVAPSVVEEVAKETKEQSALKAAE